MGNISPTDQHSGTIPESNIILNNLTYIGRNRLVVVFICSFKIQSMPELLLFFNFLIALIISDSEMA